MRQALGCDLRFTYSTDVGKAFALDSCNVHSAFIPKASISD